MCWNAVAGGHGAGVDFVNGEIVRRSAENAGNDAEAEDVRDVGHSHGACGETAGSVAAACGGCVFVQRIGGFGVRAEMMWDVGFD